MSAFAECCVCWDEIGVSKNNCTTPCGHQFCFTCIVQCLEKNNCCPLCRGILVERADEESEDEDYESDEESDDDSESGAEYEGDENIDIITERFLARGYDAMDLVTLLIGKVKKSNPKYTNDYVKKMVDDFDETVEDVETQKRELAEFAAEDRQQ
jgi:hypothetical protein